jgi:ABC-type lipoprotein export system ATPase subunit
MNIQFSNVIPVPLSSIQPKADSIWRADFSIQSGEKILLNAASGKGKTTFTHLLMGIRSDYSGDIFFNGKNIDSMMLDEWMLIRKNKIAVVYQDLQLFPELTAFENVIIKNQLTQVLTINEIEFMFEQVGLIDKRKQIAATLSMGQKQRVAIIRALCQPFEWLILDEPFSHLDNENREICFKIISESCSMNNAGMILTSLDEMDISDFDKQLKL